MISEEATPEHLAELGYATCPKWFMGFALRAEVNGPIEAIGIVYYDDAGRWIAEFESRKECPRAAHKYALLVRDAFAVGGATEIYAKPDPKIDKAEKWLLRLGFEPGEDLWRLDLGRSNYQRRSGCGKQRTGHHGRKSEQGVGGTGSDTDRPQGA